MFSVENASRPLAPWWNPRPSSMEGYSTAEIKEARARHLVDECSSIESRQRAWHDVNLWNTTLFTNRQCAGFHWGFSDPVETELFPANLATENLVQSIGEALVSKASQAPIQPTLIPRGASFSTYRMVKKLNRWVQGVWRQLRIEDLAVQAFLDAYLSGVGVIRLDHDGHGLCAESVFFDNLIVDNQESLNRAAPLKYRIRYMVPRQVIEQTYRTSLDDFEARRQYLENREQGKDWVPLVEGWMVARNGRPGRHVLASCGKLLVDETWDYDQPPLVIFRWQDVISGFYSPTGVETIVPYQLRLNELNEVITDAQDVCARPRLLHQAGGQFDVSALDNLVARVISYTGMEPKPFVWPTAIQELYAERDRVVDAAFRFFGLSQMSAQADLPPSVRLDSSAGVREFRVMEDSRFLRLWTRFEEFRLEIAKRLMVVMRSDPSAEQVTSWRVGGKARVEEIKWSEVKAITEDMYTWSMEALPKSAGGAAARRDVVEGRLAQGRLDPQSNGKELTTAPDLETMEDIATALCEEQKFIVEEIENGRFIAPDVLMDLTYGIQYARADAALLRQFKDVPKRVFADLRRYVRLALAIIQPGVEQPTAPTVAAPSLAPPVAAAAGPASENTVRQYYY